MWKRGKRQETRGRGKSNALGLIQFLSLAPRPSSHQTGEKHA